MTKEEKKGFIRRNGANHMEATCECKNVSLLLSMLFHV